MAGNAIPDVEQGSSVGEYEWHRQRHCVELEIRRRRASLEQLPEDSVAQARSARSRGRSGGERTVASETPGKKHSVGHPDHSRATSVSIRKYEGSADRYVHSSARKKMGALATRRAKRATPRRASTHARSSASAPCAARANREIEGDPGARLVPGRAAHVGEEVLADEPDGVRTDQWRRIDEQRAGKRLRKPPARPPVLGHSPSIRAG
jgi:hypothetical protein